MISAPEYKALVVDDEALLRSLVARALAKEGFSCEFAADGMEAAERLHDSTYDLVVTDLQMPNRNGHMLACEILAQHSPRPVLVVLTGVIEPRLAKDLLIRGVDDIVFKPVDYRSFAAKVKGLVYRRSLSPPETVHEGTANTSEQAAVSHAEPTASAADTSTAATAGAEASSTESCDGEARSVSHQELQNQLAHAPNTLPIPHSALDVYRLANSSDIDARQLAGAISSHELLAEEVMRLANGPFYNRSGAKIANLDGAVVQVGQKRIGQLAVAANAIAALAPRNIDWLDPGTFWPRSVAAGLAVELLVAQGKHRHIEDGLLLCATMHSVGRLVLASLFPEQYKVAVSQCLGRDEPLAWHERRTFPRSQSEVMLDVLTKWGIPVELADTLRYTCSDYESIARLDEPLRSKAELVKLAVFVAQIVLRSWEPWDLIEIPPSEVVRRLQIHSMSAIIDETDANVEGINSFATQSHSARQRIGRSTRAYTALSTDSFDLLAEVFRSLGIALTPPADVAGMSDESLVVNCVHTSSDALISWLESHSRFEGLVVGEQPNDDPIFLRTTSVWLPNSVSALRTALTQYDNYR